MLQNSTSTESLPSAENALTYSVPGKVFLLGEYAVLGGLPALVASVGPRFRVSVSAAERNFSNPFHPRSPASRLVDWARSMSATELGFFFEDSTTGGFGASTAQFALAYRAFADSEKWDQSWKRIWKLYRELTPPARGLPPSGADLVAQWMGGVVLFDPSTFVAEDVWSSFNWDSLLVFSASGQPGRKVATHEHLATLEKPETFEKLSRSLAYPLRDGIVAVRAGDPVRLGQAMTEYSECLRDVGLEVRATREDLSVLAAMPGVLGAKGAGALQADSIVLVMDPGAGAEARATVIERASERGLELVANGLEKQSGVSCLN